ncbi:hypothetical protein QTO34_014166 [Cnephaeus nilssonii]|uniref:KRAB domain-containing protein n=1 Tax=Cnephaeus nilssonii TaxID=3371016 RepID=A0AA40LCA4_CNENI|nr:hypothetical protein QTO34_014166 [Eptesicus nilssonii]
MGQADVRLLRLAAAWDHGDNLEDNMVIACQDQSQIHYIPIMCNISSYPMFLIPTIIERGQCDSYLRMRAQDMNFEDVAIAFSQEEWEILDEAQRRLYCDAMLEVFALVSFIGPWHKMDDGEAYSEHSVSVGDSQVRASKTAAATHRTHLCNRASQC